MMCLRSWPAIAIAGALLALPIAGCDSIDRALGTETAAYDGSHDLISICADAAPSAYVPAKPLMPIADGLLGQSMGVFAEQGLNVERWFWVVGPGRQTGAISFDHPVLVEVVAGRGAAERGRAGATELAGGASFYLEAGETVRFRAAEGEQLDIRSTYLLDF